MDAAERGHAGGSADLPAIVFAPARPDVRPDQYGVLGIATDFGAAGVGAWDDTKQLAGDIGGTAKSAWHGITSLF